MITVLQMYSKGKKRILTYYFVILQIKAHSCGPFKSACDKMF